MWTGDLCVCGCTFCMCVCSCTFLYVCVCGCIFCVCVFGQKIIISIWEEFLTPACESDVSLCLPAAMAKGGNRRHHANLHTDCICCHKKVNARVPRKGKEESIERKRKKMCPREETETVWNRHRSVQLWFDLWPPRSHCEAPAVLNADQMLAAQSWIKAGCCVRLIRMNLY